MKSKAQLLVEQIDKIFEERGLQKPKEVKKTGNFVYIKKTIQDNFIIHVPHASLKVPIEFKNNLLVDEEL